MIRFLFCSFHLIFITERVFLFRTLKNSLNSLLTVNKKFFLTSILFVERTSQYFRLSYSMINPFLFRMDLV